MTNPTTTTPVKRWKPGDACVLINLRDGEVLPGRIDVIRGHKMVVRTDDLRRWSADVDSSFVQRPKATT